MATIFVEFCFRSYARVFEKFNHAKIISSRNHNRISGSIYGVYVRIVYTCPNALHVESQLLGVGQPLSAYERTGSIVENHFVSCYVKKKNLVTLRSNHYSLATLIPVNAQCS